MTYPREHEQGGAGEVSQPSTSEASHLQHMVAGATAGIVEHVAMFPLDTIKTRMQVQPHGEHPPRRHPAHCPGEATTHDLLIGALMSE